MTASEQSPYGAAEAERGLFAERTALAWNRSALAFAALGGLVARAGAELTLPAIAWPLAAVLLGLAGGAELYGRRAYRRRDEADVVMDPGDGLPSLEVALQVASIGTAAAGVVAFALVIAS